MPLQFNGTGGLMSAKRPLKEKYSILIAGKYTDRILAETEMVKGLITIRQAFSYFKPITILSLEMEKGIVSHEMVRFTRANQFGKKRIASRISLLNSLTIQKEEYQNIIFQFETNALLRQVIDNITNRQYFLDGFKAIIRILERANSMYHAEVSDSLLNTEIPKSDKAELLLRAAFQALKNLGGYYLIESTCVHGIKNMSPDRNECWKRLFLEDPANKTQRENLNKRLKLWVEVLTTTCAIANAIERCKRKHNSAEKLLDRNLNEVLLKTSDMEKAYRLLEMVFRCDYNDKAENIFVIDADPKQFGCSCITDLIEGDFLQDRGGINLPPGNKLLIVPSYIGSVDEVQRWKRFAHEKHLDLITDVDGTGSPDEVMDTIEAQLRDWQQKH